MKRMMLGRGRPVRSGNEMNKTETQYANYLEMMKLAGDILGYWFEPMSLRLSKGCHYRIDFMVMMADCSIEMHEVKGHWEDDALVKIKVAAEKFPFKFIAIKKVKGGLWDTREVMLDNLTAPLKA